MTGVTTGQTALTTAVGSDDVRQYSVVHLAAVLQTLANLFDSTTGHAHDAAGKGAPVGAVASGATVTSPSISNPTITGVVKGQTAWFDPVFLTKL